jgi:hypothetical protein
MLVQFLDAGQVLLLPPACFCARGCQHRHRTATCMTGQHKAGTGELMTWVGSRTHNPRQAKAHPENSCGQLTGFKPSDQCSIEALCWYKDSKPYNTLVSLAPTCVGSGDMSMMLPKTRTHCSSYSYSLGAASAALTAGPCCPPHVLSVSPAWLPSRSCRVPQHTLTRVQVSAVVKEQHTGQRLGQGHPAATAAAAAPEVLAL